MRAKFHKYLAAAGNVTVSGPVHLHTIVVGTGTALSTITVYNGTTTSDPVVALIDASVEMTYDFDGIRLDAMHVVMADADSKATIVYS